MINVKQDGQDLNVINVLKISKDKIVILVEEIGEAISAMYVRKDIMEKIVKKKNNAQKVGK